MNQNDDHQDQQPNTTDLSASTILDLPTLNSNEDNFLNYEEDNINTNNIDLATFPTQKSTIDSPATISVDNFSDSFRRNISNSNNDNLNNFQNSASSTITTRTKNIYYSCAHCQYRFIFNDLDNKLVVCPECRLISSVSDDYKNTNGILYLLFFSILLLMADNFVRLIISRDSSTFLFYLFKSIFYIGAMICLYKSINYFTIKVSILSLNN